MSKLLNLASGRSVSGVVGLCLAAVASVPASAATSVSGLSASPTFLANLSAGTTYTISVEGQVDLFAAFNGGAGLTFTADGRPTYAFPNPYSSMYPDGSPVDPAGGGRGPAYNFNLGALVGSYTPTPASGSASTDFFLIGLGTTLTPTTDVALYGLVNDTEYRDNGPDAFLVTVAANTVPEPMTWVLLVSGFGLVGGALRRRRMVAIVTA